MNEHTRAVAAKVRKRFQSGNVKLPALPETVMKVRKIVDNPDKGATAISKAIAADPTYSTIVMRLANSARFNVSGKEIRNLPMAVQRLGGRRVLQLLISISSKLLMQVKQPQLKAILRQSNDHSLMVAAACQHLARLMQTADPEEAFLAGLLHDEGIATLICSVPEELMACDAEERSQLIELLHREMGARLLSHWHMPNPFVLAAMHHGIESNDRPRHQLIDYVDVANYIVDRTVAGDRGDGEDAAVYPPLVRLGPTQAQLTAVEIELEDSLADLQQVFDTGA